MLKPTLLLTFLLLLTSCQRNGENSKDEEPPPISYSKQVRPILAANCMACHGSGPHKLSLQEPKIPGDFKNPHEETGFVLKPAEEALLNQWLAEGASIDPHWALQPLAEIEAASVDDFIDTKKLGPETNPEIPKPLFTEPINDILAGDLSPDAWRTMATEFLRQGEDTPSARLSQVGRQFLGMQYECAQCHDHPTESITTQDYTGMLKMFTTPYDALKSDLEPKPPVYVELIDSDRKKRQELATEISKLVVEQLSLQPDEAAFSEWLSHEDSLPLMNGLVAACSFENRVLVNLAPGSAVKISSEALEPIAGAHGAGVIFTKQSSLMMTKHGIEGDSGRFTISLWAKLAPEALDQSSLIRLGHGERGFQFLVEGGKFAARWSRVWPDQAIEATSLRSLIVPDRWVHLAVSSDGSRRADGLRIYVNGHLVEQRGGPQKMLKAALGLGGVLNLGSPGVSLDEVQIYQDVLEPLEVAQLFDGKALTLALQNKEAHREELGRYFVRNFSPRYGEISEKIRQVVDQAISTEEELPEYLVMRALPNTPTGKDRLSFAKNLQSEKRFLVARALVNATWKDHFGNGLVDSLDYRGQMPIQPELLDWLAGRLLASDWNLPQLGELIRNSETWKRSIRLEVLHDQVCPRH